MKEKGKAPTEAFRESVTHDLMLAIVLDTAPHKATRQAFGIVTQEHIEALYEPVRYGEITREQLHGAVGDFPKLTAMVNATKGIPIRESNLVREAMGKI